MRKVMLAAATAMLTVLVPVEAAHADASATVLGSNAVLQDGCHDYTVSYSLNLPAGTTRWDVDVDIDGPGRGSDSTDYLSSSFSPVSGSFGVFLCGSLDPVGRYDVSFSGSYTNATYGDGAISGHGSLKLRAAKTRTEFTVSTRQPKFNQVVRLSARSQVQGKYGYKALWAATVRLQIRVAGRWKDTDIDFVTGRNGRDSQLWRWNIHKTYTFRLKTLAEDGHKSSVSSSITVNPRG